jgi:hypothetical protein
LHAVQLRGGRVCSQAFDQLDARFAGERPDVRSRDLSLYGFDDEWMRMAERVDPDASDEVEERIAIDVRDGASTRLIDDDTCHYGVPLQAWCDVGLFPHA